MIESLVAVLVAFSSVPAGGPAGTVAIVPVAGERVTLEEVPLYERVDTLLRTAAQEATQQAGATLQPMATTKAHLGALRDAGIDCDLEDRLCLAKIAVLAGVGRLLVPVARRDGNLFAVRVLVVDGAGRASEVRGELSLSDDAAADQERAAALARAALTASLGAPVAAPAAAPVAPPIVAPAAPAPIEEPTPWFGVAVLGASGVVALASGVGLAVADAALATPAPYEERTTAMAVGQVCFVGLLTGATGAALGGLLVALGE